MSKQFRNNEKKLDLTIGKPSTIIIRFAIPMFIGNLFQQAYSLIDTLVVGNYINSDALAAVGSSGVIMNMVTMIGMGLAVGTSVVSSQYYGAKKYTQVRSVFNTSLILFGFIGILGGVIGFFGRDYMLSLMNTQPKMFSYASDYLGVIFVGIVFVMLYNMFNQMSIALGDSRTPMLMLFIACIINIIGDLSFTIFFNWGTKGIAFATVLGQGFAAISCFFILRKRLSALPCEEEPKLFDKLLLKQVSAIGLPAVAQNAISTSGMLAVQSLLNSFGSITVAAYTASNKIDGFAMAPMVSLGSAVSTFTAQNIGAKRVERVKEGLKFSLLFSLGCCLVTGIIIFSSSDFLLGLFVDGSATSSQLFEIGTEYLRVAVFSYSLMALMFIINGVLRGAGDAKTVFVCSITDLLARAGFAYGTAGFLGRYCLWLSYPFGWICSCIISIPRYLSRKWEKTQIVKEQSSDEV